VRYHSERADLAPAVATVAVPMARSRAKRHQRRKRYQGANKDRV